MGSEDRKLEALAERRWRREQHRTERLEIKVNETRPHGDQALAEALEGSPPVGRSGIHGFTIRKPVKLPPFVPAPLVKKGPPKVRPVNALTGDLSVKRHKAAPATRIALPAVALAHGIMADGPGKKFDVEITARPQGAEAILAYLRSKGVALTLASDKAHIIPSTAGGRLMVDHRALIETAGPLLVAYLNGTPLQCQVAWAHPKGADLTATVVLVGGAVACAACAAGAS
jgi:hypothetical protein